MGKVLSVFILCLSLIQWAGAAPPLEAYGHLPAVENMQLSPSGERYAFIALVGETRRLGVLTDKGKVVFSADLGAIKVRNIEWVGDDRVLLTMSATYDRPLSLDRAYEFSTILNVDLKNSKASSIFEKTSKIANIVMSDVATVHLNGVPYKYFVGLAYASVKGEFNAHNRGGYFFDGDHRNLYRVNLDTNEISMQARGGEGPKYRWVVGNDGGAVAHSEYDQQEGIWRLYAGEDQEKLLLEKKSAFRDVGLLGLGRTPDTVWVADATNGANLTEEISVASGGRVTISETLLTENYITDTESRLAIGVTLSEEPRAAFFDPKLQARISSTRKAFQKLQMYLISFSRNLDRLIVKTDGGDDSGTYWLVDIKSGAASPVGQEYPEVRAADVGPTQWISYKAADGLEINSVLTLPPGRKPAGLPLVVLPHGGPIGVADGIGFDWWAQAFASAGYAVLQPNYRGSAGSGPDFVLAGYGQWGRKMQTDLSDGVAALATQGVIDAKRVCIVGANYGGYAALAGVTLQRDIYRCAVSVAGPSDMPALFRWKITGRDSESDTTRYWRAITGADKEGDGAMRSISPTYFADQASSPILLIHGKDDTVVPVEQSRTMAAALRSAKKRVEFVEMQGEDHWLSRDDTRKTMLKASVAFVREHNPPD